jgi:hypothetical protein
MVINLSSLPQKTIDEFGLLELVHDGCLYIEIQKCMYGLRQAGILMNQFALDGYGPAKHTNGLWKHNSRPVWFLSELDDFGIKYIGRDTIEHLLD